MSRFSEEFTFDLYDLLMTVAELGPYFEEDWE